MLENVDEHMINYKLNNVNNGTKKEKKFVKKSIKIVEVFSIPFKERKHSCCSCFHFLFFIIFKNYHLFYNKNVSFFDSS